MNGLNALGFKLTQRNFKLMSESELVRWEMVKQGLGIIVITEDIGDLEPLVQKALPTMAPIVVPFWLTTHRELHTSRRIRMVYDLLATELGLA
jgi:DNA-binding transcriptional LysR family regulator